MKTIHKYTLEITPGVQQVLELPIAAIILCVQTQFNQPCLWAKVDTQNRLIERIFMMCETGAEFPIEPPFGTRNKEHQLYIGTFQLYEGGLVYHLFEIVSFK